MTCEAKLFENLDKIKYLMLTINDSASSWLQSCQGISDESSQKSYLLLRRRNGGDG
jgi:hypothetical protein